MSEMQRKSLKKDQDVPEAVDTVLDGASCAVFWTECVYMTLEKSTADDVQNSESH